MLCGGCGEGGKPGETRLRRRGGLRGVPGRPAGPGMGEQRQNHDDLPAVQRLLRQAGNPGRSVPQMAVPGRAYQGQHLPGEDELFCGGVGARFRPTALHHIQIGHLPDDQVLVFEKKVQKGTRICAMMAS